MATLGTSLQSWQGVIREEIAVLSGGYWTAMVAVFEVASPTLSNTGTALPVGASTGTCALT